MKISLPLTFLLIITFAISGFSQDYVFRVLANKGRNQVQTGSNPAVSLKTGAKLNQNDKIIAGQGAYIGLVHKSGKTIELRNAGTYAISDLAGKVNVASSGVGGRYMDFVLNKMSESRRDVNDDYQRNLNATGAVERAIAGVSIKMLMKETKNPNLVLGEKITINWSTDTIIDRYLVNVKNIFGQDLFIVETGNTKFNLDFSHPRLASERFVLVNVRSKNNQELKSLDYAIKRLSPKEGEQLNAQLVELQSQLGGESPLNKLVYASFYEANNLYVEALTKYQEAADLSPEIPDFKEMYESFINANNLGK